MFPDNAIQLMPVAAASFLKAELPMFSIGDGESGPMFLVKDLKKHIVPHEFRILESEFVQYWVSESEVNSL